MPSACYHQWRKYTNSKGLSKWVDEGAAPDGACPSCPDMGYPANNSWDGVTASCSGGAIVRMLANGTGGYKTGPALVTADKAGAKAACNGDYYIGTGPITNYF